MRSLERLVRFKRSRGHFEGPAISKLDGKALSAREIDDLLHTVLEELLQTSRHLFPPNICTSEDVRKNYAAFRTLRRTSDTRALEKGVNSNDIDIVNRWQSVESKKRRGGPQAVMRHRYAQFEELREPFL